MRANAVVRWGAKGDDRRRRRALARLWAAVADGQVGVGLVETLIAVAILSVTLVTLLAAISTGSKGVAITEERITAENLARSELEYVKSEPYRAAPTPYPTVTPPAGYTVSAEATSISEAGLDSSIQKITVTVTRGGVTLLTVEDYKVNR